MDSISAKQFLISRVIEEADFERIRLSDVEKKMLHFTEVGPSLPDIFEVNEEFERTCDADEYEDKIANLLKRARDRDREESPAREQQWKDALDALKKEDHYILVMVSRAFGAGVGSSLENKPRSFSIYLVVVIAVVLVILKAIWKTRH
jgi:hypothetical protein